MHGVVPPPGTNVFKEVHPLFCFGKINFGEEDRSRKTVTVCMGFLMTHSSYPMKLRFILNLPFYRASLVSQLLSLSVGGHGVSGAAERENTRGRFTIDGST